MWWNKSYKGLKKLEQIGNKICLPRNIIIGGRSEELQGLKRLQKVELTCGMKEMI